MSEIVTCARTASADSGSRGAQSWWVPRLPKGVPEARHRTQETMRAWGEPTDRIEAAALIVTELVANAVQHTTGRRIRCRLIRSAYGVRVCVWNRGRRRVPAPSRPPMDVTTQTEAAHGPGGPHAPGGPHGPGVLRPPARPHGPAGTEVPEDPADPEDLVDPDGPVGLEALRDLGAPEVPADPGDPDVDVLSLNEDGRGLMLVDAMAARWGTHAGLNGRLVWADI